MDDETRDMLTRSSELRDRSVNLFDPRIQRNMHYSYVSRQRHDLQEVWEELHAAQMEKCPSARSAPRPFSQLAHKLVDLVTRKEINIPTNDPAPQDGDA